MPRVISRCHCVQEEHAVGSKKPNTLAPGRVWILGNGYPKSVRKAGSSFEDDRSFVYVSAREGCAFCGGVGWRKGGEPVDGGDYSRVWREPKLASAETPKTRIGRWFLTYTPIDGVPDRKDAWSAYVGHSGRLDVTRVFPVTHAGGSDDPTKEWRWTASLQCLLVARQTLISYGHCETKEGAFRAAKSAMAGFVKKRGRLEQKDMEQSLRQIEALARKVPT
jgi:hypothetical protein